MPLPAPTELPTDPATAAPPAATRPARWSPEADARIRADYGRMLAKDLAAELGCSLATLRGRAMALGLPVPSRPRSARERRERDYLQRVVAPLLACWPLSLDLIARRIGTGEEELLAALAQGKALPPSAQRKLLTLLGLNRRLGDEGPLPGPRCSYALVANDDPAIVTMVYRWLTHEVPPGFAREVVPLDPREAADDWRLLLMSEQTAFRPQLIVFPRTDPSAGLLDGTTLPGFTGPLTVDAATYRLLRRTWEEVMRTPRLVNQVFPPPVARGLHAKLLALPDRRMRDILNDLVRIGW